MDTSQMEDRAYRLGEIQDLTGIPYDSLLNAVHSGEIKANRVGRMIWIPFVEVIKIINPPIDPVSAQDVQTAYKAVKMEQPTPYTEEDELTPEQLAEIDVAMVTPRFWQESSDETPGSIHYKWKANFHGHKITVFESDFKHGWTFVVDGLKPRNESTNGLLGGRAFLASKEIAQRVALMKVFTLPDVPIGRIKLSAT